MMQNTDARRAERAYAPPRGGPYNAHVRGDSPGRGAPWRARGRAARGPKQECRCLKSSTT